MSFLQSLYVNLTLASMALFGLLAVWSVINSLCNSCMTPNYRAAWLASQLLLVTHCLCFGVLWLAGRGVGQAMLAGMYHLVALIVLPCVRLYLVHPSPRRELFHLALAAFFTIGMIIRAAQTGLSFH